MSNFDRAGTRSRRPQGIFDGGALLPIIDTTGDGIPDQNKQTPVQAITTVALGGMDDTLGSAVAGENGYSTQNQRYLHIFATTSDGIGNQTFLIGAYNYAIGRWANLETVDGDDSGGNLGFTQIYQFSAPTNGVVHNFHYIVPIHGVDRVSIIGGGHDASTSFRLAVSTF